MKRIFLIVPFIVQFITCFAQEKGKPWNVELSDNSILPMVWIPSGEFMMGSPESEADRKPDEFPQHRVRITSGYWIGKTEVTIGQWKAVMGESFREHVNRMLQDETIYEFGDQKQKLREYMHFDPNNIEKIIANENDELPMYFVSWHDAMDFCVKLTAQEQSANRLPKNYKYSLPTEAQWEYACRAGTTTAFYSALDSISWYGGNSTDGYQGRKLGRAEAGPRSVATKKPNAWGVHDMSGNLWEWCLDWYGPYPAKDIKDPIGVASGTGRTNRGGSWGSGPANERSAARASNPPAEKSAYRGFRIVLSKM